MGTRRSQSAPGRGKNRPAPSLVYASFLGREAEWADPETGEIRKPPVAVSFIEYPDGGGELVGVACGPGRRRDRANTREFHERLREERNLKRLIEEGEIEPEQAEELARQRQNERQRRSAVECARRAKSHVRRLCRQYALRIMVTLTFPGEGIHEYDLALRYVQDFIHDHGHLIYRKRREWLAVPELHPGGHGWHWHVLVPYRFSKAQLQELRIGWTEFLRRRGMPPSGGAAYTRIDVKAWRNSRDAASYAAKYVGKTFEDDMREKGRKRYLRPRGLKVEVQRGGASSLDEVRAAIEVLDAEAVFESSTADDWLGPPMVWSSW